MGNYSISSGKEGEGAVYGLEVVERLRMRDGVARIEGRNMLELMSASLGDYIQV